jgi:hypothetical protein
LRGKSPPFSLRRFFSPILCEPLPQRTPDRERPAPLQVSWVYSPRPHCTLQNGAIRHANPIDVDSRTTWLYGLAHKADQPVAERKAAKWNTIGLRSTHEEQIENQNTTAEDAERWNPGEIDWLAYAIAAIGGCGKPGSDEKFLHRNARELGITHQKVIAILEHGVSHLTSNQVIDISKRTYIPMSMFRLGPPPPEQDPTARVLGAALIEGAKS